jgi:hypothetical protein
MQAYIVPKEQLQPIDLVTPGFRGLNTAQSGSILSPAYCTQADNAVIDSTGRLAARDGVTDITTTPVDPAVPIKTLFEYKQEDGTLTPIIAWDGGISTDLADPEGSDISGTVDDADGTWRFQNFNDVVVGFQEGLTPIVYNGTGTFAEITESSGTAPTGEVAMAAFGRLWAVDADGQTIKYSGLLDYADWGSVSAGQIDMSNIWTQGTDIVSAIAEFNGLIVVFGRKHIVFFGDGNAGILGVMPTQLAVVDIISGTGCLSQYSLQPVGEADLLFLAPEGVQSLSRVIQEKSNPITTLTKYVRDDLLGAVDLEDPRRIRSTYNPILAAYILSLPATSQCWVLDQRSKWVDDTGAQLCTVTKWTIGPTALFTRESNQMLLSIEDGYVSQYAGANDRGETFRFVYQSPWLDLGEQVANYLKILKRLGAIIFVTSATTIIFKWSVDFRTDFRSSIETVEGDASAEWGEAEFGEDEFGGGLALRIIKKPARHKGQYYRLGIEAEVEGEFALQQSEMFAKIGRLA